LGRKSKSDIRKPEILDHLYRVMEEEGLERASFARVADRMGGYSASKFALEGLTEALSMEVKPFGIKVCMVEPGDLNTEIIENQIVADLSPDSPYYKGLQTMRQASDQNMANAPGPNLVANMILKIVNTASPRLRYRVGNTLEKASISLKALLPSRLFERIFLSVYGLD